jgi:hypothetical protein
MLPALNRSAVIVTPKQPFLDWIHAADPTSLALTLDDLEEPTIYLLPDCEDDADLRAHVKNYSDTIFEDQLDGWYRERSGWPADRDFETFCLWFEYRAHTLVLDFCDDPLAPLRIAPSGFGRLQSSETCSHSKSRNFGSDFSGALCSAKKTRQTRQITPKPLNPKGELVSDGQIPRQKTRHLPPKNPTFQNGILQTTQRHCRGDLDEPKTKKSRRTLALGTLVHRDEAWISEKKIVRPNDWIFFQEDDRSKPMWDSGVRKALKIAAQDAGWDFPGLRPAFVSTRQHRNAAGGRRERHRSQQNRRARDAQPDRRLHRGAAETPGGTDARHPGAGREGMRKAPE